MANTIPSATDDIVERIAQETLARRGTDYAGEVRRILDAALEVMRERGTASRTRVADIVAAAGLSNDAFYRHFASKDDLVAALLENGAVRLASYVSHQMDKEPTPEGKLRRWVDGVLSQTEGATADTTRAVLSNAGSAGHRGTSGREFATERLAALLHEPFRDLGSTDPVMDAALVAHAVLGMVSDCLWRRDPPSRAEVEHITVFCFRAVTRP